MREKHLTLWNNIGTFAEEDEAFDLLTRLTWLLPIIIVTSAAFDLVLAIVYLKWLHPWKIILQEVCCCQVLLIVGKSVKKIAQTYSLKGKLSKTI